VIFVCNITQPYIVLIKKVNRSQKDEIGPQIALRNTQKIVKKSSLRHLLINGKECLLKHTHTHTHTKTTSFFMEEKETREEGCDAWIGSIFSSR